MPAEQAMAQVLNWLLWHLENGKNVEIRLPEPREQTVYVVELQRSKKHGLYVTHMQSVPELFGKVLHHWNIAVTYQTLSVKEIKISIECADTLNSFNDVVFEKSIDELVDSAIRLDLPDCCECC